MRKQIIIALSALLLAGASIADADQLEKGDREIIFRFSYSNLDFDGPGGDSETTEIAGSFGYMLTDHHEVGFGLGYASFDSSDSVEYGAAYTYNFRAGTSLNPFLSTLIVGFGGDLDDVFDLGYGVEAGVKVYPWEHGGVLFGVTYRELTGADGVPDASHLLAFAGLTLKF
ncbi:MAG: outer membrane beta-barrel protein [bacterium]|nr:outer membrane beta-barrel protein [bacterium]